MNRPNLQGSGAVFAQRADQRRGLVSLLPADDEAYLVFLTVGLSRNSRYKLRGFT
jgi:hypothetical protein